MPVRDLIRPLPGVRRPSLLRQRAISAWTPPGQPSSCASTGSPPTRVKSYSRTTAPVSPTGLVFTADLAYLA